MRLTYAQQPGAGRQRELTLFRLLRPTWGNPLRNVSQGGGVSSSFRAGDEESVLLTDSEARNAILHFPAAIPRNGWSKPTRGPRKHALVVSMGIHTSKPRKQNSMTLKGLVLSERPDEYTGKKGLVKQQVVTVIDQEAGNNRLTQPLEYSLSEDEKPKYAGKLQDKTIRLAIREIIPFGGRLRVRGNILEVEGLK
jgi:hypothetical protein